MMVDDYTPPSQCLMDGDYCSDTTEDFGEEYIPPSLWMLLEEKKRERKRKELTISQRMENEFTVE